MINILSLIENYQILILIGLVIFLLILFVLVIIILKSVGNLEKRYRKFMRGVDNKNIEEVINSYMDKIDAVEKENKNIKELCTSIDVKVKGCVQKVSLVRYRAFEDVGSDLSFSVAMLDEANNGVVITGIYGRNESTTYAKPIDKGISRYDLSEEEQQVLDDAINKG
jgi:Na+-transporting methylmalonyl-CoA/oxaloacetate decarboxylase gamma subunit